jgi:hypothetical protein
VQGCERHPSYLRTAASPITGPASEKITRRATRPGNAESPPYSVARHASSASAAPYLFAVVRWRVADGAATAEWCAVR